MVSQKYPFSVNFATAKFWIRTLDEGTIVPAQVDKNVR